MNFQTIGPAELLLIAKFFALPLLFLGGLVAWLLRLSWQYRSLAARVRFLERETDA